MINVRELKMMRDAGKVDSFQAAVRESAAELFDLFLQTDERFQWAQRSIADLNERLAPAQEAQTALEKRVADLEATLAEKTATVDEMLAGLHEGQVTRDSLVKERDALRVQVLTVEAAMRKLIAAKS